MNYGADSLGVTKIAQTEPYSSNFTSYLSQITYLIGEVEDSISMLRRKNAQLFGETPSERSSEGVSAPSHPALYGKVYEELAALQHRVEELRKEIKIILEI